MFLRERADYGTHFDYDTTSGKTDGKLPKGMKNHFDTADFLYANKAMSILCGCCLRNRSDLGEN